MFPGLYCEFMTDNLHLDPMPVKQLHKLNGQINVNCFPYCLSFHSKLDKPKQMFRHVSPFNQSVISQVCSCFEVLRQTHLFCGCFDLTKKSIYSHCYLSARVSETEKVSAN